MPSKRPDRVVPWFLLTASVLVLPSTQLSAGAKRGEYLARRWCAECHALRVDQTSRDPEAPSFPKIAAEPSSTEYALRVFLNTPHATMPNIRIRPDDATDIVEYILSWRR